MALFERCWIFGNSPCAPPLSLSALGSQVTVGTSSPLPPAGRLPSASCSVLTGAGASAGTGGSNGTGSGHGSGCSEIRRRSPQAILPLPPQQQLHSLSAAAPRRSVTAQSQASNGASEKTSVKTEFKHVLLPIIDRNPYLSESTRQAAATTTALAKKYGADITVVVIVQDSQQGGDDKEAKDRHELQLRTIRWHLSEGGFEDYTLVEKMEKEQTPTAVIGELADDLGLDLVIMDTEAIHQKRVDANLLVEFVPCPVLMLPL